MIILGIDPGSRICGFGLIEIQGRKVNYLNSGILKTDSEDNFYKRLKLISELGQWLLKEFKPDVLSLESLIYVKNVSSMAKLAQARGAIISGILSTKEIPVFEYSPNLIKSVVTGFGHSPKDSVEKAVNMFLGKREYKASDESDALAIALCHFFHYKPQRNFIEKGVL